MYKINLTFQEKRKTRNRCYHEVRRVMQSSSEALAFWSKDAVAVWATALAHWGKEILQELNENGKQRFMVSADTQKVRRRGRGGGEDESFGVGDGV